MSETSCRSVCRYYDADSTFRKTGTAIFRKFCPTCNLDLVSRYTRCPCCHDSFGRSE